MIARMSLFPCWLPGALGFFCAIASGLTGFGDAILFHVLFALCGAIGLVPVTREAVIKAVLYLAVIPLALLPQLLWARRHEVLVALPFSFTMACSAIPMVYIGTLLLFKGDLMALKIAIGVTFLLFSGVRLVMSVHKLGLTRESALPEPRQVMLHDGHLLGTTSGTSVAEGSTWDTRHCTDAAMTEATLEEGSLHHLPSSDESLRGETSALGSGIAAALSASFHEPPSQDLQPERQGDGATNPDVTLPPPHIGANEATNQSSSCKNAAIVPTSGAHSHPSSLINLRQKVQVQVTSQIVAPSARRLLDVDSHLVGESGRCMPVSRSESINDTSPPIQSTPLNAGPPADIAHVPSAPPAAAARIHCRMYMSRISDVFSVRSTLLIVVLAGAASRFCTCRSDKYTVALLFYFRNRFRIWTSRWTVWHK
jgi:hypothetical protein